MNGRLLLRLDAQTSELAAGETYAPGIAVGEEAPAFAREGVDGLPLSLEALLAPGLPVALVFTDPDCGACREPLEHAARVQRGGELTVAIIGRGTPSGSPSAPGSSGWSAWCMTPTPRCSGRIASEARLPPC